MLLLIDNFDSFVFNLKRYLVRLGQSVEVVRNNDESLLQELPQKYSAIVISPGPCRPCDAGHCIEVVRRWSGKIPILGICLGHQVIFEAFGGTVDRAREPLHGKCTSFELSSSPLFNSIPTDAKFARYHSLIGKEATLPDWLEVIAWSKEREIMGVVHKEHATYGIQFHPESILSVHGMELLQNFLSLAGQPFENGLPQSDLMDTSQIEPPEVSAAAEDLAVVLPGS